MIGQRPPAEWLPCLADLLTERPEYEGVGLAQGIGWLA